MSEQSNQTDKVNIRKIFVGGLSWDTTDEGFREFFSQFGDIEDSMVMRDRVTGTSRGFGFVTFTDREAVDRVLAASSASSSSLELDGRKIDPKPAVPRVEQGARDSRGFLYPVRTVKVFVGGLSQDTSSEDLLEYFSKFGDVADANVMMDQATGRSRGFGFITFDSEDTVEDVVKQTTHIIRDKEVECKKATPKRAAAMSIGSNRQMLLPLLNAPSFISKHSPVAAMPMYNDRTMYIYSNIVPTHNRMYPIIPVFAAPVQYSYDPNSPATINISQPIYSPSTHTTTTSSTALATTTTTSPSSTMTSPTSTLVRNINNSNMSHYPLFTTTASILPPTTLITSNNRAINSQQINNFNANLINNYNNNMINHMNNNMRNKNMTIASASHRQYQQHLTPSFAM